MNNILRQTKVLWKRHGSTVLTCVGGVGVVATSVMAVKATPKAMILIEKAKQEKGEDLTKLEKVKVAGSVYIPSIIVGVTTIASIFGANYLNKRQQAALMSAYAMLNTTYKDHKKKVEELYGKDANHKVSEEIAKDKYEENDISVAKGKELFYDDFSGRYFESTIEDVQRAEYRINRDLHMSDAVTLNDFYELLGLDPIASGDELGWSTSYNFDAYWQTWIDFTHSKTVMDDGQECHIIRMMEEPTIYWDENA